MHACMHACMCVCMHARMHVNNHLKVLELSVGHDGDSIKDSFFLCTRQRRRHHVSTTGSDTAAGVSPRTVVSDEVEDIVGVFDDVPRVLVHAHLDQHVPTQELLLLLHNRATDTRLHDHRTWHQHLLDGRLQSPRVCHLGKDG